MATREPQKLGSEMGPPGAGWVRPGTLSPPQRRETVGTEAVQIPVQPWSPSRCEVLEAGLSLSHSARVQLILAQSWQTDRERGVGMRGMWMGAEGPRLEVTTAPCVRKD